MLKKYLLKGQANKKLNSFFNTSTAFCCCNKLIIFAFNPSAHDFPARYTYFIQEMVFIFSFESRQYYCYAYVATYQNKTHKCPEWGWKQIHHSPFSVAFSVYWQNHKLNARLSNVNQNSFLLPTESLLCYAFQTASSFHNDCFTVLCIQLQEYILIPTGKQGLLWLEWSWNSRLSWGHQCEHKADLEPKIGRKYSLQSYSVLSATCSNLSIHVFALLDRELANEVAPVQLVDMKERNTIHTGLKHQETQIYRTVF